MTNPVVDAVAAEIEGFYAEASNNPCTCEHDEIGCPHCNAWDKAGRDAKAAILEAFARHRQSADAALVEAQWQDIQTAPKDGTQILVWSPGNKRASNENARDPHMRADRRVERYRWQYARELPEAPYTHWQPLPTPPALTRGERT